MLVLNENAQYIDIWVPVDLEVLFQERERFRQEALYEFVRGRKEQGRVAKRMAAYITKRVEILIRRASRRVYVQQT
jgi:hypothetical protein